MFNSSVRGSLKNRLNNAARQKSESCRYFAKDDCPYGVKCFFAHGDENLQQVDKQMIDKISILWNTHKLKQHKKDKNTKQVQVQSPTKDINQGKSMPQRKNKKKVPQTA